MFAERDCYAFAMKTGLRMRRDALRRYVLFRMKSLELLHFYLLTAALTEHGYTPPNDLQHDGTDFANSVRTACIGWLATIVDQTREGMNVFDLWRQLFPKHGKEIERVWKVMEPQMEVIKEFRDRVAFHVDTPLKFFAARDKVRTPSPALAAAVQSFMDLEILLLRKEDEELPDFVPAAEELLLDLELQLGISINREWFKRALILPRENYKRVFG